MSEIDAVVFQNLFRFAHRNAFLDAATVIFAVYVPYLLLAGFAAVFFSEKNMRRRIFLLCEAVLAVLVSRGIVTELIRFFWNRLRPFEALSVVSLVPHDLGGAFPSGHMAFYMALAMIVWYINRTWGAWYGFAVFLVGVGRIVAGLHWPFDIAGGIVLGALVAVLVHRFFARYDPERKTSL